MIGRILSAVFCASLLITGVPVQAAEDIVVSDAWVMVLPPSNKNTAAYLTISNNSAKDIILDSVSTFVSAVAEIHEMSRENGMMKMAMLKELAIPAGGKVVLEPGGLHLMLINLNQPLKNGDIVPITLHLHDGQSVVVQAQARSQL